MPAHEIKNKTASTTSASWVSLSKYGGFIFAVLCFDYTSTVPSVWCQLLCTQTLDIYDHAYTSLWTSPLFPQSSFFFTSSLPLSLLTLFFYLPFICLTSVVWSAVFFSFPFLSPQLVLSSHFILQNTGMVINLTLLLHGDTILLWLIEVPSESLRRCRSSLSHSLTGNPLYCFIDRRQ